MVLLLGADVRIGVEAVPVHADDGEQLGSGTTPTSIARRRNGSKLHGHYDIVPGGR